MPRQFTQSCSLTHQAKKELDKELDDEVRRLMAIPIDELVVK